MEDYINPIINQSSDELAYINYQYNMYKLYFRDKIETDAACDSLDNKTQDDLERKYDKYVK